MQTTKGLRIASRCSTVEQFVSSFHRFCEDSTIFIPHGSRPVGAVTPFSFDLESGESVLAGVGSVIEEMATAENRFGRTGILLAIQQLGGRSASVYRRVLDARQTRPSGHTPAPVFARASTTSFAIPDELKAFDPAAPAPASTPRVSTSRGMQPLRAMTVLGMPTIDKFPAGGPQAEADGTKPLEGNALPHASGNGTRALPPAEAITSLPKSAVGANVSLKPDLGSSKPTDAETAKSMRESTAPARFRVPQILPPRATRSGAEAKPAQVSPALVAKQHPSPQMSKHTVIGMPVVVVPTMHSESAAARQVDDGAHAPGNRTGTASPVSPKRVVPVETRPIAMKPAVQAQTAPMKAVVPVETRPIAMKPAVQAQSAATKAVVPVETQPIAMKPAVPSQTAARVPTKPVVPVETRPIATKPAVQMQTAPTKAVVPVETRPIAMKPAVQAQSAPAKAVMPVATQPNATKPAEAIQNAAAVPTKPVVSVETRPIATKPAVQMQTAPAKAVGPVETQPSATKPVVQTHATPVAPNPVVLIKPRAHAAKSMQNAAAVPPNPVVAVETRPIASKPVVQMQAPTPIPTKAAPQIQPSVAVMPAAQPVEKAAPAAMKPGALVQAKTAAQMDVKPRAADVQAQRAADVQTQPAAPMYEESAALLDTQIVAEMRMQPAASVEMQHVAQTQTKPEPANAASAAIEDAIPAPMPDMDTARDSLPWALHHSFGGAIPVSEVTWEASSAVTMAEPLVDNTPIVDPTKFADLVRRTAIGYQVAPIGHDISAVSSDTSSVGYAVSSPDHDVSAVNEATTSVGGQELASAGQERSSIAQGTSSVGQDASSGQEASSVGREMTTVLEKPVTDAMRARGPGVGAWGVDVAVPATSVATQRRSERARIVAPDVANNERVARTSDVMAARPSNERVARTSDVMAARWSSERVVRSSDRMAALHSDEMPAGEPAPTPARSRLWLVAIAAMPILFAASAALTIVNVTNRPTTSSSRVAPANIETAQPAGAVEAQGKPAVQPQQPATEVGAAAERGREAASETAGVGTPDVATPSATAAATATPATAAATATPSTATPSTTTPSTTAPSTAAPSTAAPSTAETATSSTAGQSAAPGANAAAPSAAPGANAAAPSATPGANAAARTATTPTAASTPTPAVAKSPTTNKGRLTVDKHPAKRNVKKRPPPRAAAKTPARQSCDSLDCL